VRRMAAAMLAYETLDRRSIPVFRAIVAGTADERLRRHATLGHMRLAEAGLTT
jgi:hypothetical protein